VLLRRSYIGCELGAQRWVALGRAMCNEAAVIFDKLLHWRVQNLILLCKLLNQLLLSMVTKQYIVAQLCFLYIVLPNKIYLEFCWHIFNVYIYLFRTYNHLTFPCMYNLLAPITCSKRSLM